MNAPATPGAPAAEGTPAADPAARRLALAAACLALVVGAVAVSFWVAHQNFTIADFNQTPKAGELLAAIEGDEARTMAARWFASESNRALFSFVGVVQLAGAAAAFLLGRAAAVGRAHARLLGALLSLELVLAVALAPLVPWMVARGREIDFVSRAHGNPPEVRAFLAWHGVYFAGALLLLVDALLLVLLLAAAAGAPRSASSRPDSPRQGVAA
jgi:hypothetical protein